MRKDQRGSPEKTISRGGSVIKQLLTAELQPDRNKAGISAISILEGGS
jgi:hypothetical protein